MFCLDRSKALTNSMLATFLQTFNTSQLPKLKKMKNYYDGKQDICNKVCKDPNKPCNRIVVNYCSGIVDNFNGYLTGIPVSYTSKDDITDILDVLKYNDYREEDSELLRNALIYGVAYEVEYIDEDGETRFNVIDSQQGFPIYSDDLNKDLLYFVRFYPINPSNVLQGYYVELYGFDSVIKYKTDNSFSALRKVRSWEHYFHQVPVVVFDLNEDDVGSFEKIISMQDSYNKLLSASEDDFEAFCDAYMVLKGMDADDDTIAEMKQNRLLLLDGDGEASYLTKDIKDTALNNLLDELNGKIHRVSNSPDFGDENFANASGISLKYKLLGFENTASNIATRLIKALQKRIELISEILYIKDSKVWRDVNIIVSRNLPIDIAEIVETVSKLKGVVSDKTLLAQIPFVNDIDGELSELDNESKKKDISVSIVDEEQ